jgi:hypothetical protein
MGNPGSFCKLNCEFGFASDGVKKLAKGDTRKYYKCNQRAKTKCEAKFYITVTPTGEVSEPFFEDSLPHNHFPSPVKKLRFSKEMQDKATELMVTYDVPSSVVHQKMVINANLSYPDSKNSSANPSLNPLANPSKSTLQVPASGTVRGWKHRGIMKNMPSGIFIIFFPFILILICHKIQVMYFTTLFTNILISLE